MGKFETKGLFGKEGRCRGKQGRGLEESRSSQFCLGGWRVMMMMMMMLISGFACLCSSRSAQPTNHRARADRCRRLGTGARSPTTDTLVLRLSANQHIHPCRSDEYLDAYMYIWMCKNIPLATPFPLSSSIQAVRKMLAHRQNRTHPTSGVSHLDVAIAHPKRDVVVVVASSSTNAKN